MQFAPRKPDAALARAELKRNVTWFLAIALAVRAAPYVLGALQKA